MGYRVTPRTENYFVANAGAFHADANGLNTYPELLSWCERNGIDASMPVYNGFDDAGIFATLKGQMAFQAWHDRRHIIHRIPFTLEGEHQLAVKHLDELLQAGLPPSDCVAIYFHIFGRNLFYYNHGHTPVAKVGDFIADAFARGISAAAG